MTAGALLSLAASFGACPAFAEDEPPAAAATALDWRAMRIAGEKSVADLLILPKTARFDWQRGWIEGAWRPYNSRPVAGWISCGAVYGRTRVGYEYGAVFVVVVRDGHVIYADMDMEPGGPINRACNTMKLPPPQPGMLGQPTP